MKIIIEISIWSDKIQNRIFVLILSNRTKMKFLMLTCSLRRSSIFLMFSSRIWAAVCNLLSIASRSMFFCFSKLTRFFSISLNWTCHNICNWMDRISSAKIVRQSLLACVYLELFFQIHHDRLSLLLGVDQFIFELLLCLMCKLFVQLILLASGFFDARHLGRPISNLLLLDALLIFAIFTKWN